MAFLGGELGYRLLRALWSGPTDHLSGKAYANKDKLQLVLGLNVYEEFKGKIVVDFGCGEGLEAIRIAQNGAARVIGLDIQEQLLVRAREMPGKVVSATAVNLPSLQTKNAMWLSQLTVLNILTTPRPFWELCAIY
jgi:ribosomal protein L11 methylase PrmA